MDKKQAVIDAINAMKAGPFGLTGVKVELEAQLDRRDSTQTTCFCGSGGLIDCVICDGVSSIDCPNCSGTGQVANPAYISMRATPNQPRTDICDVCYGRQEVECQGCDGEGTTPCSCQAGNMEWGQVNFCHDFILERLVPLGLAEPIPNGASYNYGRRFRPKGALVFSKFYRDGSVDSEHTFTLSVEDPRTILLLPRFIEIFNELAKAINRSFDISGAGMHMAFLNSQGAVYPVSISDDDYRKFRNFRKSMILLLPALYFLGTGNEVSRGLSFRRPEIEQNVSGKYHAVNYGGGAVEFRVFDTCYDKPEVILDNVVVMAKAMKYWRLVFKSSGLEEICRRIDFGNDKSDKLDRFYCKKEHIDLLNKGLTILKPSYYTVEELKKQRNFCITRKTLETNESQRDKDIETEYKEYEQRFDWKLLKQKSEYMAKLSRDSKYANKIEQAEKEANRLIKAEAKGKRAMLDYIAERKSQINRDIEGQYTLAV